jgi:UDP-2,3-diacylglucosamine pyrophosphatase LpxH
MSQAWVACARRLEDACAKFGGMRLISRLRRPDVFDAPEDVVRIFVPDLHLLPTARARTFQFSFEHDAGGVAAGLRAELLRAALEALAASDVEIHQLGDFVDFWRATDVPVRDLAETERVVESVLRDYRFLGDGFVRPNGSGAKALFVAGNHDGRLLDRPFGMDAVKTRFVRPGGGDATILVTHGDAFDPLEEHPKINEFLVRRFGKEAESNAYRVEGTGGGDPNADVFNVRFLRWSSSFPRSDEGEHRFAKEERAEQTFAHELLPLALATFKATTTVAGIPPASYAAAERYRLSRAGIVAVPADVKPRLVVVGHSHRPRLLVCTERDREANAPTGRGFAFLDCGAWIERSIIGGKTVASAHLGVQFGPDLRLYQLGEAGP